MPIDQRELKMLGGIVERLTLVEVVERRREFTAEVLCRPERLVSLETHDAIAVRLGNGLVALGELESATEVGAHVVGHPEPPQRLEDCRLLRRVTRQLEDPR